MKETFTAAVLGVGSRGFTYIRIMEETGHFNVVSLCDRNPAQIDKATALLHLPRENLFFDEDRFFEKKRADVLVIATYDKDHVRHCLKALRLGYDVLLEKPVSDSEEELKMLLETQEKTGKKVVVCHVLRYSAPFIKVGQLLREGAIGRLIAIDALAARSVHRLCTTLQMADTGIIPGSGIGNSRRELSRATLGLPVLAVGVPTVVDGQTLAADLTGGQLRDRSLSSVLVTSKDIDSQITDLAKLIGFGLDLGLQEGLELEDIELLLS